MKFNIDIKHIIKLVWYFIKVELPQVLSNWRAVPRLMMALYAWMVYDTIKWFTALPDPTNAQAGLVSIVVGAGAGWFAIYTNTSKPKEK